MNSLIKFIKGEISFSGVKIHYLRIGNTMPLLDKLRAITDEIKWVQHEEKSFEDYYFANSYAEEYDGAIINLGVNDENISQIRKDFWENFIFKTEDKVQTIAIIIPPSDKYGSLTRSQVIEFLSLIRLTDRAYEVFEYSDNIAETVVEWLGKMCGLVHKKEREDEIAQK